LGYLGARKLNRKDVIRNVHDLQIYNTAMEEKGDESLVVV